MTLEWARLVASKSQATKTKKTNGIYIKPENIYTGNKTFNRVKRQSFWGVGLNSGLL